MVNYSYYIRKAGYLCTAESALGCGREKTPVFLPDKKFFEIFS
jgi:hypothetical protein